RGWVSVASGPVAVAASRQPFGAAGPGDRDVAGRVACLGVSLLGLAGRVATVGFAPVGTSGRGRHEPRASRLNTTGMYSIVRNPLYVANFLVVIGIALATRTWWFPALTGLCFALVHERIVLAHA